MPPPAQINAPRVQALSASPEKGRTQSVDHSLERVDGLDVLRGLMAMCVAIYHFAVWTHAFRGVPRLSNLVAILGIYSVEGFFVISGFCFFHVYRDVHFSPNGLAIFYVKRAFRLAPLYYLALLGGIALGQSASPAFGIGRLIENLTLSFGLFHPNHSMVLGGWSIGLEVVFYLTLPLLLWLTRRDRRLSYVLLVGLLALFVHENFIRVPEALSTRRFHEYVRVSNHAFLFAIGGVLSDLRRSFTGRLRGEVSGFLAVALVWLGFHATGRFRDHFEIMVGMTRLRLLVLCVGVVAIFAYTRSLKPGPLLALGRISYALYLLHPFAWLMIEAVRTALDPAIQLGTGLVLALLLAVLATQVIEQPALKLGRMMTRQ